MKHTGTVCSVICDRGFGFVRSVDFADDVFFHARDLADDLGFDEQLRERRVTFTTIDTAKGRRAVDVRAEE